MKIRSILGIVLTLFLIPRAKAQPPAEWTVMVFMNGNNNLEPFSITNFCQMAKVGSTSEVNIVTQWARMGNAAEQDQTCKYGAADTGASRNWSGVKRFRVARNMSPVIRNALEDAGPLDMGSGATLSNFVVWAATHYPAKHYFLILWDHGQGYRARALGPLIGMPSGSPVRSISNDDVHHSKLYMRDVEDSLHQAISSAALHGVKLDLVGFDACLMSMVETGYALRNVADFMVGSQELEPGQGWRYEKLLAPLVRQPEMDTATLAKTVVDAYRQAYGVSGQPGADPTTTLAVTDLSKIGDGPDGLSQEVSALSDSLIAALPTDLKGIKAARDSCQQYSPNLPFFFHIDVGCIASALTTQSTDAAVKTHAARVLQLLHQTVIDTYAGADRIAYGSNGLCIYFPRSAQQYAGDMYAENGYEKDNASHPVEFVQNEHWADFLHAYFAKVPS